MVIASEVNDLVNGLKQVVIVDCVRMHINDFGNVLDIDGAVLVVLS